MITIRGSAYQRFALISCWISAMSALHTRGLYCCFSLYKWNSFPSMKLLLLFIINIEVNSQILDRRTILAVDRDYRLAVVRVSGKVKSRLPCRGRESAAFTREPVQPPRARSSFADRRKIAKLRHDRRLIENEAKGCWTVGSRWNTSGRGMADRPL